MGRSRELTGNPTNGGTPGVQVGRQGSTGVHRGPGGGPGVPDGFLVNIHHL